MDIRWWIISGDDSDGFKSPKDLNRFAHHSSVAHLYLVTKSRRQTREKWRCAFCCCRRSLRMVQRCTTMSCNCLWAIVWYRKDDGVGSREALHYMYSTTGSSRLQIQVWHSAKLHVYRGVLVQGATARVSRSLLHWVLTTSYQECKNPCFWIWLRRMLHGSHWLPEVKDLSQWLSEANDLSQRLPEANGLSQWLRTWKMTGNPK